MFLIVGLGNPGKSYINNKHNLGYKVIDTLSNLYHSSVFSKKFKSEFLKLEVNKNIIYLLINWITGKSLKIIRSF